MNKRNWNIGDTYFYISRYYGGKWTIYECYVSKIHDGGHITFITLTALNTGDSEISFGINGDVEYGSMLFRAPQDYAEAVKRLGDLELEAYDNSYSKLNSNVNRLKRYDKERDLMLHTRLIETTRDTVIDTLLDMLTEKQYAMGDLKPFVLMEDIMRCMNELKTRMPIDPNTKKPLNIM